MDIGALGAAQGYTAARPATGARSAGTGPGSAAKEAARDFAATLEQGEAMARAAMTGDADPHALVLALAQSELAVETVVTVRDKVVEAYQEILRMPV